MANNLENIDFSPPEAVQQAAQKGLELKDEFGGKGLQEHTVAWARHLADGKPSDPAQARRMRAWFHRHKVDRRSGWDDPPTPGYVAWLLWGGDAAEGWAEDLVDKVEAQGGSDAPMASAKHPPRQRKAKAKAKKKTGTRGAAKKATSRGAASKKTASKKKASKKKASKKKAGRATAARAKTGKKKVARRAATGRKAAGRSAKAGKASARKAAGRSKKTGGRAKKVGARKASGRKKTRR